MLLVSPAGSGKSVIIAEIARMAVAKGGHVLFMVHRKELVEQIEETFRTDGIDLTHTTIMTVGRIKNRLGKLPKPTLIITDETHHALAKTYRAIYDYYPDVPRLGFTATPWRLSGAGFKDVYDDLVEGPTVKWLIDHHYLAPFTLYGFENSDQSLLKRSSTGDYTNASMDAFAKRIIYGDIIKNWQEKANGQKTIIYCHAVWFSQAIAKEFNEAGIPAVHVDSKTPAKARAQMMADFKAGKVKILCNVDLVSEGFNVPDCSCVVMLRPTKSLVLYTQQAMRSMRYQLGKQATIIDQVSNYERFGLPDTDRNWSLNPRKPKRRGQGSGAAFVKTCPECYRALPIKCLECPECGHKFAVKKPDQDIEIDKQAKLTQINNFNPLTTNYLILKRPEDLNSVDELKAYAKLMNYKSGWVWYQQKQRGWL